MVMALSAVMTSTRWSGPLISRNGIAALPSRRETRIESGNATGGIRVRRKTACHALPASRWANVIDKRRSNSVIAMPVAPVERVHGNSEQKNVQTVQRVDLILSQGIGHE